MLYLFLYEILKFQHSIWPSFFSFWLLHGICITQKIPRREGKRHDVSRDLKLAILRDVLPEVSGNEEVSGA